MKPITRNRSLRSVLAVALLSVFCSISFPASGQDLESKSVLLNEPFLEWEIGWDEAPGDPFDVVATATFTHEASGEEKTSLMYYAGDGTWRFRFTGTQPGTWQVRTSGPGALGGRSGEVTVEADSARRKGFLKADGTRWVWEGTGEEHVPQLVMSKNLPAYWTGEGVDTTLIDAEVREFVDETGFTGFHKRVAGYWFDVEGNDDTDGLGPDVNPDPRAFDVLETFIIRAYASGTSTHLWLWGSDSHRVGWGGGERAGRDRGADE